MPSPAVLTIHHCGHYEVRPKLGLYVVYDCAGKRAKAVRLADGVTPAIFACAFDAFFWVIRRIMRRIGE